jgi:hypothetical protein
MMKLFILFIEEFDHVHRTEAGNLDAVLAELYE